MLATVNRLPADEDGHYCMYEAFGRFVEKHWIGILVVWMCLLVVAASAQAGLLRGVGIPRFEDVTHDGEFSYLPSWVPSVKAEAEFAQAFSRDLMKSSVVIVVRRESALLQDSDKKFIDDHLQPALEQIRTNRALFRPPAGGTVPEPIISSVLTYRDRTLGRLLDSEDNHSTLVMVGMTSEFLEWRNKPTIDEIQNLVNVRNGQLAREGTIPAGLDLALSGTATVGRDMNVANRESSEKTEVWTVALVVLLLVGIYRAPILAIIPLVTVFMSRQISMMMVALLTQVPGLNFKAFMGMDVYITVVMYGAGVDYCLFLIARYKEELDAGLSSRRAATAALTHVGEALIASAATVICGIGMMYFAEFGKFSQAGLAISLSLVVTLMAAMTFTPAMLCWAGRLAFWPHGMSEHFPGRGTTGGTTLLGRLIVRDQFQILWEQIGNWLIRRPGLTLMASILLMLPFAGVGVAWHGHLSYGLLSELSKDKESVVGAEAVKLHYPAGYVAPVTVLVKIATPTAEDGTSYDFADRLGPARDELLMPIIQAVNEVNEQSDALGIADIRHVREPLGRHHPDSELPLREKPFSRIKATEYFVSNLPPIPIAQDAGGAPSPVRGNLTRFEIVFNVDPFAREIISKFEAVEKVIHESEPVKSGKVTVSFVGPTPSIRDLKVVTDGDQIRIDVLVLGGVLLILVLLLRQIAIPVYLITTVFFSYLVTLGITFVVFLTMDPANFSGLDWKVPIFLFTILIAIGEDYNIFLMARIAEEQQQHGPVEGVRQALLKTGGIISSCGVIMAGTFCSLILAGSLVGMQQLGFALAFGVLLDTFVVRPILVPAYLILLHRGQFGVLGKYLGALPPAAARPPIEEFQESVSTLE